MENKDLPAFGHGAMTDNNGFQEPGLSKREYFAGLAMQGMVSRENPSAGFGESEAKQCVFIADELLKQLEDGK